MDTSHTNSGHSDDSTEQAMGFWDHIEDLRKRLLRVLMVVGVGAVVALYFGEEILAYFTLPLQGVKLHYTEIGGAFAAYFKVSLFVSIIGVSPYIFWQLWGFVAPGLYRREKRMALSAIVISTVLFLTGAAFCFFVVLPYTILYLVTFEQNLFTPIITIDNYISFAGWMIVSFGAGFTMPVIAYFLAKIGILAAGTLTAGRRYAAVILLFIAAILTPSPDILSQLSLAIPLYALYEISAIVVWVVAKRRG